jgi:hypothetical protein
MCGGFAADDISLGLGLGLGQGYNARLRRIVRWRLTK